MIDGRDHRLHHSVGAIQMCLFCELHSPDKFSVLTESTRSPETIQTSHIGVHVVNPAHQPDSDERRVDLPVAVRWRLLGIPHPSGRELPIQPPLRFTLIINTIESNNPLQKDMEFRMG
jgi:hypothetical protein